MTAHPTCETCAHAEQHKARGLRKCLWLSNEQFEFLVKPVFYCAKHSDLAKGEEHGRPEGD